MGIHEEDLHLQSHSLRLLQKASLLFQTTTNQAKDNRPCAKTELPFPPAPGSRLYAVLSLWVPNSPNLIMGQWTPDPLFQTPLYDTQWCLGPWVSRNPNFSMPSILDCVFPSQSRVLALP